MVGLACDENVAPSTSNVNVKELPKDAKKALVVTRVSKRKSRDGCAPTEQAPSKRQALRVAAQRTAAALCAKSSTGLSGALHAARQRSRALSGAAGAGRVWASTRLRAVYTATKATLAAAGVRARSACSSTASRWGSAAKAQSGNVRPAVSKAALRAGVAVKACGHRARRVAASGRSASGSALHRARSTANCAGRAAVLKSAELARRATARAMLAIRRGAPTTAELPLFRPTQPRGDEVADVQPQQKVEAQETVPAREEEITPQAVQLATEVADSELVDVEVPDQLPEVQAVEPEPTAVSVAPELVAAEADASFEEAALAELLIAAQEISAPSESLMNGEVPCEF